MEAGWVLWIWGDCTVLAGSVGLGRGAVPPADRDPQGGGAGGPPSILPCTQQDSGGLRPREQALLALLSSCAEQQSCISFEVPSTPWVRSVVLRRGLGT